MIAPRPKAVLFDLLTGLIDSWTLWDSVAGTPESGRRWRAAYLRITYGEGRYRPYEALVCEAAVAEGLPPGLGDRLVARYGELQPWPEARDVLAALAGQVALGVVTNCSEALGQAAARSIGVRFDVVVTAERAGFYKPHLMPYRLALGELGRPARECLFVAGSPFDLFGAAGVGLPVFWHNRIGMVPPPDAPAPLLRADTLHPLLEMLLG